MEHVLTRATRADIQLHPFPHLVIENVVDEGLCRQLISEFPKTEIIARGAIKDSNKRYSFSAKKVRASDDISKIWKEFIETHISQSFLESFLDLFEEPIRSVYPDFEEEYGRIDSLRAGVRDVDNYVEAEVLLDAQICINTPVIREPSSVKIAHLDDTDKLFAGLFYLRHPDDDSRGGKLELYRYRAHKKKFHGSRLIDERYVEVVKRVPYRSNTLVLFLNSLNSLHGVTIRNETPYPRLFMNLVGEVQNPLFNLTPFTEGVVGRTLRRFKFQ